LGGQHGGVCLLLFCLETDEPGGCPPNSPHSRRVPQDRFWGSHRGDNGGDSTPTDPQLHHHAGVHVVHGLPGARPARCTACQGCPTTRLTLWWMTQPDDDRTGESHALALSQSPRPAGPLYHITAALQS